MGSPLGIKMDRYAELSLNAGLIREEFNEFMDEAHVASSIAMKFDVEHHFMEDLLKELADLVYVCYHFANTFNLPLDSAIALVHQSNMSKLGEDGKPIRREDGKVLKGENYKPADLSGLLKIRERQMSKTDKQPASFTEDC